YLDHSILYLLPSAQPPGVCTPTCPAYGSISPCCISLVFLLPHDFFPSGAALSGCPLPGISRRSSDRWHASWASSVHKVYRQSAPATKLPAAFPLCSQSPPVNETSLGGNTSDAANTFSVQCAGSRLEYRTYAYSSGVSHGIPCSHSAQLTGQFPGNSD